MNTRDKIISELYLQYRDSVYRICYRHVKDKDLAEDLMHEVFIKVYNKMDCFEGRSQVFTWVYRLTVNHCLDYLRMQKRRSKYEERLPCENNCSFETGLLDLVSVNSVLKKMSQSTRRVVDKVYFAGLSQKETAQALGVSQGFVGRELRKIKRLALVLN